MNAGSDGKEKKDSLHPSSVLNLLLRGRLGMRQGKIADSGHK